MPSHSFTTPLATRAERRATGRSARDRAPLDGQGRFEPAPGRDVVGLLLGQATTRVPELVPIRHGRMLVSPFTFFRGAALPMAADLAASPSSGLTVQLCGDAHLSNFGAYASPERRLVFDINDFDETLPGPFEWDVKRLAASLVVASRDNGFSDADARAVALAGVAEYHEAMRQFTDLSVLEVWRTQGDVETRLDQYRQALAADADRKSGKKGKKGGKKGKKKGKQPTSGPATSRKEIEESLDRLETGLAKARRQDSTRAARKLTEVVDGQRRIRSDPPIVVPMEQLSQAPREELFAYLSGLLAQYVSTLPTELQHLLAEFRLVDVAHKVVGVGSVGTRAWILLLETSDGTPLVLQAKQAEASVLSRYLSASRFRNMGHRVVQGQRAMQAASDPFLGWVAASGLDGQHRDFYVRQLKDWKASAEVAGLSPRSLAAYAVICGWVLARAHAKTGDRLAIAAYLGKGDRFDRAIVDFGVAYADQTVVDHAALAEAVASGRAEAVAG